jgi:hypothetical protein
MPTGYIYKQTGPATWAVGHYDEDDKWVEESPHRIPQLALARVRALNGAQAMYVSPGRVHASVRNLIFGEMGLKPNLLKDMIEERVQYHVDSHVRQFLNNAKIKERIEEDLNKLLLENDGEWSRLLKGGVHMVVMSLFDKLGWTEDSLLGMTIERINARTDATLEKAITDGKLEQRCSKNLDAMLNEDESRWAELLKETAMRGIERLLAKRLLVSVAPPEPERPYDDVRRTFNACLLVTADREFYPDKPELTEEIVAGWTPEQRRAAWMYAAAAHANASDNPDVKIPPRPPFLVPYL